VSRGRRDAVSGVYDLGYKKLPYLIVPAGKEVPMQNIVRRRWAAPLVAALFGLLAALPAANAGATTPADAFHHSDARLPDVVAPDAATYQVQRWLTPDEAEELLASLPVGEGGEAISPQAIAEVLAGLPAFEALEVGHLEESLQSTLEGLGSGATLEDLENPASLATALQATLEGLLSGGELLGLNGLLGGESLAGKLEEALSSVDVNELLAKLLGSSGEPAALLEQVLSLLPPEALEGILGAKLGEGPISTTTVGELAGGLGTTTEELVQEVDETTQQLPETTEASLAPLANGELLSIIPATNRLVLGTLSSLLGQSSEEPSKEEGGKGGAGEGGEGGSGEGGEGGSGEGGTGGQGGNGGNGSSGGGGSGSGGPTVIVNVPSSKPTGSAASAGGGAATSKEKIVVLRHRVHGSVAMIVVKAPGAGELRATGRRLHPVKRRIDSARRLSFIVALSKAAAAKARRRAHRTKVRLRIVFAPTQGTRSHAVVKLRFR
jgi:hypothetical protein